MALRTGEATRSLNALAFVISYCAILFHREEKEVSGGILLNQCIILNSRINKMDNLIGAAPPNFVLKCSRYGCGKVLPVNPFLYADG